jgi:glycine hydroxymethyltransferase
MMASFGVDGRETQDILDEIGLSANSNAIPNDTLPPYRPSGLRLGTPAMTTRGLTEGHMEQVAEWMLQAVKARSDKKQLERLHQEVIAFARQFPLPSDR